MIKNVIVVNDFAHINGGAGKIALTSAKLLKSKGYRVFLFCAVMPKDKSLEKNGIEFICTEQYDILHNPSRIGAVIQGVWNRAAYKAMDSLLSSLSVEETVVHLHGFVKALSPSILFAIAKHNVRTAYTLHDYFGFCPNGGLFNYRTKKICRKNPSSLNCFFCNCDSRNYMQKWFRNIRQLFINRGLYLNKTKLAIIPIGKLNEAVSKPHLNRLTDQWNFLQNPIDLYNGESVDISKNKHYLFVGRLSSEKGINLFCEAISQLGLHGCVLGDGYLLEEYKSKYPSIEFAGWVTGEKKLELLKKGKCLVFPSLWYEGAPLTIVEMKSYGIPCIVPDECAACEEVEDGKTGFIFKSGNIESLKQSLLQLEKSNLIEMQRNVRRSIDEQQFSEDLHLKNLINIYEKI